MPTALHRTASSCALALMLSLPIAAARADVLIDNLGEPLRFPTPLSSGFWYAQAFLTPAGDPLRLDAVTARLGLLVGAPGIVAELRADAAGSPGAMLTSFTIPALGAGATTPTPLLAAATIDLAPLSTYWLLLGATGDGGYEWQYAEGNGASGSGSFGAYAFTTDQGLSWAGFGIENPLMMRVDVSPVPEPAAWGSLASGLLLLAARRWRLGGRRPGAAPA